MRGKKYVQILQVRKTFPNMFEIVVRRVVCVQVEVFAVALLAREQQGNGYIDFVSMQLLCYEHGNIRSSCSTSSSSSSSASSKNAASSS